MEFNFFKKWMESPIYSSLEELFDLAELNDAERNAFLRYQKYSEYWLLRSLRGYHRTLDNSTNFIKKLARAIIDLDSEQVEGDKKSKIKELFAYGSPVRKITQWKGVLRARQNSPAVENAYFELLILSFFVRKGYKVKLIKSSSYGKKIPEFIVYLNEGPLAIEAKKINSDSIQDSIFGDQMLDGFDYQPTERQLQKGYQKIKAQIEKRYNNAINKYSHLEANEYYLIFMDVYFDNRFIGGPAVEFINSLQSSWENEKLNMFLGVVIPDQNKTSFIPNSQCPESIVNELLSIGILDFHLFEP